MANMARRVALKHIASCGSTFERVLVGVSTPPFSIGTNALERASDLLGHVKAAYAEAEIVVLTTADLHRNVNAALKSSARNRRIKEQRHAEEAWASVVAEKGGVELVSWSHVRQDARGSWVDEASQRLVEVCKHDDELAAIVDQFAEGAIQHQTKVRDHTALRLAQKKFLLEELAIVLAGPMLPLLPTDAWQVTERSGLFLHPINATCDSKAAAEFWTTMASNSTVEAVVLAALRSHNVTTPSTLPRTPFIDVVLP